MGYNNKFGNFRKIKSSQKIYLRSICKSKSSLKFCEKIELQNCFWNYCRFSFSYWNLSLFSKNRVQFILSFNSLEVSILADFEKNSFVKIFSKYLFRKIKIKVFTTSKSLKFTLWGITLFVLNSNKLQ